MKKVLLAVAVLAVLVGSARAESPIKLSLWGPVAYPSSNVAIKGLDLGIGSSTQHMTGVQFDLIYAQSMHLTGVQFALVTSVGSGSGVQLGMLNMATDNFTGLQWGLVNYATRVTGLQLGFVNYAEYLDNGLR